MGMSELEALRHEVDELRSELARHVERTEGLSAEQMRAKAEAYVRANPDVWARIKSDAARAAAGRKRFSMAKEFEELRECGWLQVNEDEDYRCNNSYRAPLARMLADEVPQVRGLMTMRRSKVDKFYREDR